MLSSAYHPQSQTALEWHHQTLKNMLRVFCWAHDKDWDAVIPYVMFAVHEAPTKSLGFSPNQIVFGYCVCGPLDVVCDTWFCPLSSHPEPLLALVLSARERLGKALSVGQEHLGDAQKNVKGYFDWKAMYQSFDEGDEVLVLLLGDAQKSVKGYYDWKAKY